MNRNRSLKNYRPFLSGAHLSVGLSLVVAGNRMVPHKGAEVACVNKNRSPTSSRPSLSGAHSLMGVALACRAPGTGTCKGFVGGV